MVTDFKGDRMTILRTFPLTINGRGIVFSLVYTGILGGGRVAYQVRISHTHKIVSLPRVTTLQTLASRYGIPRFHETGRKHTDEHTARIMSTIGFSCEAMISQEVRAVFLAALAANTITKPVSRTP
jgi:hypothetical protein